MFVGRADQVDQRGGGGLRHDVVTVAQHGQKRHRDVGEMHTVAPDDQGVVDDGVVPRHLRELPGNTAGQRNVSVAHPIIAWCAAT